MLRIAIGPAAREGVVRGFRRDTAGLSPIAVSVALVSLFLGVEARSLIAPDAWLALVAGREIAAHGLPSADHLTILAAGRSWVDQQWLAQILFYRLDQWVGAWAVTALSLLAYLAAFGIAAGVACRRNATGWVVGGFFVAAVASSPWAMGTGPQALALPLFALTILIVDQDPDGERSTTLWLLPLLCLWANLHGSAVLGALLICLFGMQALIRRRGSRRVTYACLLAPLTLLVSPYALKLPGYYKLMLVDPPFAGHAELWQRTTPSRLTAAFFTLVALGALLVIRNRRRLGAIHAITLILTLAAALDAVRGIVWFGLASLALLPPLGSRCRPRMENAAPIMPRGAGAGIVAPGLIAAATAMIVWGSTRPAVFYNPDFPPALTTVLRSEPATARALVDARYSDWVLWKVPSLSGRVAYDARLELLTRDEVQEEERFREMRPNWKATTRSYRLVISDRKHVDALLASGGWRLLYSGASAAVAARV